MLTVVPVWDGSRRVVILLAQRDGRSVLACLAYIGPYSWRTKFCLPLISAMPLIASMLLGRRCY
jgi:hypothetical protein